MLRVEVAGDFLLGHVEAVADARTAITRASAFVPELEPFIEMPPSELKDPAAEAPAALRRATPVGAVCAR